MFTELKIKRICNSFKAPDIEIPLLSAKAAKRPRLKPVLATAALALVIVGASVVGIKGNIFKGEQPLPPVDTDTPDTPDTPTPPDTDTPTPPEDDVKIIYADSDTVIGSDEYFPVDVGKIKIDPKLEEIMNSKENDGCKFAVYLDLTGEGLSYNSDLHNKAFEFDERYRLLSVIKHRMENLGYAINRLLDSSEKFLDIHYSYFVKCRKVFVSAVDDYKTIIGEDDELYLNKEELETINKLLLITEKDLDTLKELNETLVASMYHSINDRWWFYQQEFRYLVTDEVIEYFANRGVKIELIDVKEAVAINAPTLHVFEAVLSKEEIYSLEGTNYGVRVIGRREGKAYGFGDL